MATKKISQLTAKGANLEANDLLIVSDYNGSTYDSKYVTGAEVMQEVIQLAVSDETTALTTGTAKLTFRMPFAMTVTEVRSSLSTAGSTSGTTTIDINEGGVSILSTKLTIDAISGGATEAGLKVTLIGNRA